MNTATGTRASVSLNNGFRLMHEHDLDLAAAVYTRAFYDDPLVRYVLPEEHGRFERLKAIFERYLLYGVRHGEVHTPTGPVEAGAMWLGPDNWHVNDDLMAEAGFDDDLAAILGDDPARRFDDYFAWMNGQHEKLAPPRHLYLAVLAVDSHRQGQGVGSALIRHVTTRADEEGLPCYLETQQPKNVPLYLRHGFEVVQDVVEPVSRVRTWAFVRQPR